MQFSVQPPAFLSCFSIKLVPGLVRWIDATVHRDIDGSHGLEDTHDDTDDRKH